MTPEVTRVINTYFLKICHHSDITGIFIAQSLFDAKDKFIRSINLNATLLIVFKNVRDSLALSNLSRQVYPSKKNILVKILNDITKNNNRGYLALYLDPDTKNILRLRSSIFAEIDGSCSIYSLR